MATDCVSQAILSLLNEKMPTRILNIEESNDNRCCTILLAGQVDVVVGINGAPCNCRQLSGDTLYRSRSACGASHHRPSARRLARDVYSTLAVDSLANRHPIRISIDNALVDNGVMLPENTIESASMNVSAICCKAAIPISILSLRLAQRYAGEGATLAIFKLAKN